MTLAGLALAAAACGGDATSAPPATSGPTNAAAPAGPTTVGSTVAGSTVAGSGPRVGPLTPTDPARLRADESAAIVALGRVADRLPPDWFGKDAAANLSHHAHAMAGPATTVPLTSTERTGLDAQWAVAVDASATFDSEEKAAAQGYVRAAVNGPGVGVHWVKWSLVDTPFDAAHPAMLLFDERREPARLAGFSYWVRSATAPEGFAGPNDIWHQHAGLCIVNGWVDREEATGPKECAGTYLGGRDLWMMHAWPVPAWKNRWGDFATLNPSLCPANAGTPDISRCPDTFSFATR